MGNVRLTREDWDLLDPESFESLCADLLTSFGFRNVARRGGPGDKGQDVVCDRLVELGGGFTAILRWVVQCKHVRSLSKTGIREDLDTARQHKPDFWWLMTSANASEGFLEWLRTFEKTDFPFRITCIDGRQLGSSVLDLPRLLARYFAHKLAAKEQSWVAVMDLMSRREYETSYQRLTYVDDGKHPRISYLQACCLSMIAASTDDNGMAGQALQHLEEAARRGYVEYMTAVFGWPANKCRAYVRSDPELHFLRERYPHRFQAAFDLTILSDDEDNCCEIGSRVRSMSGVDLRIEELAAGAALAGRTPLSSPNLVMAATRARAPWLVEVNREIRTAGPHRFWTSEGWRRAEELRVGDLLRTIDGWRLVQAIRHVEEPAEVVKLSLGGSSEYFANGYLVHNDK